MTTAFTRSAVAVVFAAASLAMAGAASADSRFMDYDKGSHLAAKTAELTRDGHATAKAGRSDAERTRERAAETVDGRSMEQVGKLRIEDRGR